VDTRGFTFYGGFIAAALELGAYVWRQRLSIEYLDAIALGLPLGYGIGRIGDIINGEHYAPATAFFLGVRNTPARGSPRVAVSRRSDGRCAETRGFHHPRAPARGAPPSS
jgi:prolipoprotein diacylglyceryltransferase